MLRKELYSCLTMHPTLAVRRQHNFCAAKQN